MTTFKDHFSKQAADYARYRPRYPASLFAWLAEHAPARDAAWDCGAGNGQAAVALADYFASVFASEPSAQQLAHAIPDARVEYRQSPAEESGLPPHTIDLIVSAQAVHWFDFERFYAEVHRVAKPKALVALWCYHLLHVEPAIDALIYDFYEHTVGPYWPFDRTVVEDRYETIPFPFEELRPPDWQMEAEWTLDEMIGYIGTWSAVQRYAERTGVDPMPDLARRLAIKWGKPSERKRIVWPVHARAGRVA